MDDKLNINFSEPWIEIEKKINEYFSNPKNVKKFKKELTKEMNKPCYIHLGCMEPCKYRMPKDFDMGTILWCSKYLVGQEELCNKECGKRWTYEPNIGTENI